MRLSRQNLLERLGFIQRMAVDIDLSRVNRQRACIPVAPNAGGIGIVFAENPVANTRDIGIAVIFFPIFNLLRACDYRAERNLGTIGNPRIRSSGVFRVYILAVNAGSNQNFVASTT